MRDSFEIIQFHYKSAIIIYRDIKKVDYIYEACKIACILVVWMTIKTIDIRDGNNTSSYNALINDQHKYGQK